MELVGGNRITMNLLTKY